jgi:hypothetical protein
MGWITTGAKPDRQLTIGGATAMTVTPDLHTFVLTVDITSTVGWVGEVNRVGFQSSKGGSV